MANWRKSRIITVNESIMWTHEMRMDLDSSTNEVRYSQQVVDIIDL